MLECVLPRGHAQHSQTAATLCGLRVTETLSAGRSHWGVSALSTAAGDRMTSQNTLIQSSARARTHAHTHTKANSHMSWHSNK